MSHTKSILSDIIAFFKRLFTKTGESIVDANAIAIIEQRVRDAQDELDQSNEQLANIMAKRRVQQDSLSAKQEKLAEYGKHIQSAMQKGQEELAREVAAKFAELETETNVLVKTIEQYDAHIKAIKERNRAAEDVIKNSTTRIDLLKSQEAMIDASAAVSDAHSGADSSLTKALETADRLEQRQKERMAQLDAAAEIESDKNGASLEKKLEEAGIIVSSKANVDDILSRFK